MNNTQSFEEQMLNKSDQELVCIIFNKNEYVAKAINAAEFELQRRQLGSDFIFLNKSDEELVKIFLNKRDYLQVVIDAAKSEIQRRNLGSNLIRKVELELKAVEIQKEYIATRPLSFLIGIIIFFASASLVAGFFWALILSHIYKRKGANLKASQCWKWFITSFLIWFLLATVIIALNSN